MSQQLRFNHNSDKGFGPAPNQSGLLLDILCSQSDDYIARIKNNIEKFSKYMKSDRKYALTHVQYVYRTLTNVEVFKSISSNLTKAENHFLTFLCNNKKKAL